MSDKKISELTAATSVGLLDALPLVQSGNTVKVTADVLFNNVPGNLRFAGNSFSKTVPDLVYLPGSNLSLATEISHVSNTTNSNLALSLGLGTQNQEKIIIATTITTNQISINLVGAGFTYITFLASNGTAKLVFSNSKWYILSLSNATVS